MNFDPPLISGCLQRRYKRFFADVALDDPGLLETFGGALDEVETGVAVAHCPNSGRMTTCAEPGWRAWLSPSTNPKRKLKWTLEVVEDGETGGWVLVNTQRPNRVVEEGIVSGAVPSLLGYSSLRREVRYGENSRVDLLLEDEDRKPPCWVEVKSASLRVNDRPGPNDAWHRMAAFPDAVTARGAKHLDELALRVAAGDRAVLFFLLSRTDCDAVRPADDIDPAYGVALRRALATGVEVIAHRAEVSVEGVSLGRRVPVIVDAA